MLYNLISITAVLLNNNDVRPITAELVGSEIAQEHKPNFDV